MSERFTCEKCGSVLPNDVVGGLCAKCLMIMAMSPTQPPVASPSAGAADLKRAILSLKLLDAEELDRIARDLPDDPQTLARALVRAGKLTSYQAGALVKGRTRGLVIGNYFVLDKLGAGGMGVVFKAKHRRLGRIVALKTLAPSLARDPDVLRRFRREVDVAAGLNHPNIVAVLDADEDQGIQFMTMEYIQGKDLDHLVRDAGPLAVDLALDCLIQAARGLEAAHAQGIVHRDIKPGNLMLDGAGQVRVLDLGLARLVLASNPLAETTPRSLTQTGVSMGTVDFMAPEQGFDSRRVDHRADIYSLGCTLCYLLTGRPPFERENIVVALLAHQNDTAESLRVARPDIPASLDLVYLAMMAKKPDDRPASMGHIITLLEACRAHPSDTDSARMRLQTFAASAVVQEPSPSASKPAPTSRIETASNPPRPGPPSTQPILGPGSPGATTRAEPAWEKLIDVTESQPRREDEPEPEDDGPPDRHRLGLAVAGVGLGLVIACWATGFLSFATSPHAAKTSVSQEAQTTITAEEPETPVQGPTKTIRLTDRADDVPAEKPPPTSVPTEPAPPANAAMPVPSEPSPAVAVAKPADTTAPPSAARVATPGFTRTPLKAWLFDASLDEFNDWVKLIEPRGFRPLFASAHVPLMQGRVLGPGPVRIAAIAVRDGLLGRVDISAEDIRSARSHEMTTKGFYLINLTTYYDAATPNVISLYANQKVGKVGQWYYSAGGLNDKFMANEVKNGFRIYTIGTRPSRPKGTSWHAVLGTIENKGFEWKFHKELGPQEFKQILADARTEKFRPESLFVCPKEGDVYLGVVLVRDNSGLRWEVRENLTFAQLKSTNALLTARGYGPDQVIGFTLNGESRYVACWTRDPNHYPVTGVGDIAAAPIDEAVEQFLIDRKIPSATLAVFHKGSLASTRGFGSTDRDRTEPTLADARMPLGELSSSLVATSVRAQLRKKKLGEDALLSELLQPPRSAEAKKPTPVAIDGPPAMTVGHLLDSLAPDSPRFTDAQRTALDALLGKGSTPPAATDDAIRDVLLARVLAALGAKAPGAIVNSEVLQPLKIRLTVERDAAEAAPGPVRLSGPVAEVGRYFLNHQFDGQPIRAPTPGMDGVRTARQGNVVSLVMRRDEWLVVAFLTLPDNAPPEISTDLRECLDLAVEGQRKPPSSTGRPAGTP